MDIAILDAEQACRVVREAQPDNKKFHQMVDDLIRDFPNALGYGFAYTACSFCGHKMRSVFPVPSRFPFECCQCHRMTCYIDEEPNERTDS